MKIFELTGFWEMQYNKKCHNSISVKPNLNENAPRISLRKARFFLWFLFRL